MRNIVIGLGMLGLLGACQESNSTSKPDLVNGKLATAAEYPATVVYLMKSGSTCTATKVSKRHLLTAAHCVTEGNGALSADFAFNTSVQASNFPTRDVNDTSLWHGNRVKSVSVNPEWTMDCQAAGVDCHDSLSAGFLPPSDIAVIEFRSDLPAQWPLAQIDRRAVRENDTVTLVGYGCEFGTQAADTPLERKKFAHTYVTAAREINKPNVLVRTADLNLFDARYFLTPGAHFNFESSTVNPSLCPGDSGGPVYRKGTNVVVGVHADYSFYDNRDGYSWVNVHTRIADASGLNPNILPWLEGILPSTSFTTTR